MNHIKQNARNVNKCRYFRYYRGKRGCKFEHCHYDDEKLEAIAKGRIKRERREQSWEDM